MKTIAWVCGTSAVGKETFINSVSSNYKLLGELNWQNRKISYSKISVSAIASSDQRDVENQRAMIADEAISRLKTSDIVLIKWQYIDSDAGRIRNLQTQLPNARHIIIHVTALAETIAERLKLKSWWTNHGKELEAALAEQQMVADYLAKYPDLQIVTVDNN